MSEKAPRMTIRLELTCDQKEQIREATGREVSNIELRLAALPRAAAPSGRGEVTGSSDTSGRENHAEPSPEEP